MILYSYFRSSAAFRVRIALNLKQLNYTLKEVHLVNHGGEQHSDTYRQLNPQQLVPTLVDGEIVLQQSLAIIEYLDEVYPQAALLPESPAQKAEVRAIAQMVACDIHPLNNLRVLQYLQSHYADAKDNKQAWYEHWIAEGFAAMEALLKKHQSGPYCFGEQVSLADICLIPQMYNAYRFNCDLKPYPTLTRIYHACLKLSSFKKAHPDDQMAVGKALLD